MKRSMMMSAGLGVFAMAAMMTATGATAADASPMSDNAADTTALGLIDADAAAGIAASG